VICAGAHDIQQVQPSPAPIGADHDRRSGKEHEDLAAVDSNRAGLRKVPDGDDGREPVVARHDVKFADRSAEPAVRSLAPAVKAERLMQAEDVFDPVDHQIHALSLNHGDDRVDTRIAREGAGMVNIGDTDPPVEALRPRPASRRHHTGEPPPLRQPTAVSPAKRTTPRCPGGRSLAMTASRVKNTDDGNARAIEQMQV
jgi:hypothetical protein